MFYQFENEIYQFWENLILKNERDILSYFVV